MTVDEKLKELNGYKGRYVAAVDAMSKAAAAGEKSDLVWEVLLAELNAADSALQDAVKRLTVP